jgi:hypothetical protein
MPFDFDKDSLEENAPTRWGQLAQLVRASRLHREGRWFKSVTALML